MDQDRLIELLTEIVERLGGGTLDRFADSVEETTKGLSGLAKQEKINELVAAKIAKEFERFDKTLKSNRKSLTNLASSLDIIEEELELMTDSLKKSKLEEQKKILTAKYLSEQYKKAAGEIVKSTAKIFSANVGKGAKDLVTGLQDGASGVTLASGILTTAIDTVQGGMSAAATAGTTLGTTLATSANPRVKALGVAAALASQAFGYITETMSDLAKFGINVMLKEVEKTTKAFNETSAAGAMFTDGMTGFRQAANESGLTVEQFANVIKANSATLADTGMGVTEAARRMGQVGKIIKTSQIEPNLMKLGFSFEEHAGLVAETMASMRRSGTLGTATNTQIAATTEQYAKNLRFLADLTGKDVTAAMKEAQAKMNQYAVDARIREIAKKNPLDAGKTRLAVEGVTAMLQQAGIGLEGWMQQLATSTDTFTGANAVASDWLSGTKNIFDVMIGEISRGNTDVADILAKGGIAVKGAADAIEYGSSRSIASAATFNSNLSAFPQAAEAVRNFANFVRDPAAIKDAMENRVKNEDKATNDFITTMRQAQQLRLDAEAMLTKQFGNFGKVVEEILTGLKTTIDKLGFSESGFDSVKSNTDSGTSVSNVLGMGSLGFYGAAGIAALAAPFTAGTSLPLAAALLTAGHVSAGAGVGASLMGYNNGGIASGPLSGYQATLHGTEAVVPLPDNQTIPVQITDSNRTRDNNSREMMSVMTHQTSLLSEILRAMKDNNQLTSGILQSSY